MTTVLLPLSSSQRHFRIPISAVFLLNRGRNFHNLSSMVMRKLTITILMMTTSSRLSPVPAGLCGISSCCHRDIRLIILFALNWTMLISESVSWILPVSVSLPIPLSVKPEIIFPTAIPKDSLGFFVNQPNEFSSTALLNLLAIFANVNCDVVIERVSQVSYDAKADGTYRLPLNLKKLHLAGDTR
jgi:hypothetical protein